MPLSRTNAGVRTKRMNSTRSERASVRRREKRNNVRAIPMLLCSLALLSSTVSSGGGSVIAPPGALGGLAAIVLDRCAAFTSTPAVPGTIVPVSAPDAASFPSVTSCAEAASLRNGAIIVAKGVPEAQIDALVGLDSSDLDVVATSAGASVPVSVTPNQSLNAEAFALDSDGAL